MAEQTIVVQDTQAPVLTGVPADVSAGCDAVPPAPATGSVVATDNCDPSPTVVFTQDSIPGGCAGSYTLVRTWTATDACGNESSATQTIEVGDSEAPVIAGVPADITAECSAIPDVPADVVATDNCNANPTVEFTQDSLPGTCPGEYTLIRQWAATDACGNTTMAEQTIVVQDTETPVLTGVPADVNAGCDEVPNVPDPASIVATDNCDPSPTVVFTQDSIPGGCAGSYTLVRTWTATDACGNETSATQTIEVGDSEPPVIAGVPADITAECSAIPDVPADVVATDNCNANPTIEFTQDSLPGTCPGEYTLIRQWTATDACGNTAMAEQTIVVQDTQAPVITGVPADVSAGCDA
ncbi:MAG: gliding motility-associated C-terminal domain-containing protein, partial [Bacteroidetes bacterium]